MTPTSAPSTPPPAAPTPPAAPPAPAPVHLRLSLWQIDAIGACACALLALVWYFAGLQPISEARASRDILEGQLAERESLIDQLYHERSQRRRDLAELEEQLNQATVRLEPVDHINRRIQALTALAAAEGAGRALRIDEIKPGVPTVLPRYTIVPIRIAGTGGYTSAARFLHALKESFPDTGVVGFELRAELEASDKPPYFAFNLLWYAAPGAPPAQPARPAPR